MSVVQSKKIDDRSATRWLSNQLMDRLAQAIDDTDEAAALVQVAAIRRRFPAASAETLVEKLILEKCRDTAVVGATTSSAMLIPGLGTLTGLTLGIAADMGLTFKKQAELVLEIAAVYEHPLTTAEKRRVVLLVTGVSAGTTSLAHRAGSRLSQRAAARLSSKVIVKALPVVGIGASATMNAVTTYIIGKRAQAYFTLDPESLQDWADNGAAITGLKRETLLNGAKISEKALRQASGTAVNGVKKTGASLIRWRQRRRQESDIITEETIQVFDMSLDS